MFDLAWSEIALIAVVAIVVIGPKDLPDAVRGVARMVRKARQMASEFRGQADELVREANLHEVRDSLNEIRNFNYKDTFEKAVDADGSIRKTFEEDPLRDYPHPSPTADNTSNEGGGSGFGADPFMPKTEAGSSLAEAPAFVPPAFVEAAEAHQAAAKSEPPTAVPPAFVPPASIPPAFIPLGTAPAASPTHSA